MATKDAKDEKSDEQKYSEIQLLSHHIEAISLAESSHKAPSRYGNERCRPKHSRRISSRPRGKTSTSGSSTYETDSPFYGENLRRLPSSTSHWDVVCLETLNIFYHDQYLPSPLHILDMIHDETGCFWPLDEDGKKIVEYLQNSMCFNASVEDILKGETLGKIIKPLREEMRKDICNLRRPQEDHEDHTSMMRDGIQDFISTLQFTIAFQHCYLKGIGSVAEKTFEDVFRSFAKLCGLYPAPGTSFKGKKDIFHHEKVSVSSESGIVLIPKDYASNILEKIFERDFKSVHVVSVIESKRSSSIESIADKCKVRSLRHKRSEATEQDKTRPSRSKSESSDKELAVPHAKQIYRKIKQDILGQHGAELMLHREFYIPKLHRITENYTNYLPGMIVVGTEVIFTLLVIKDDHMRKLGLKDKLDSGDKAVIYYSEPKDLFKKEDRDILLLAFSGLNNV